MRIPQLLSRPQHWSCLLIGLAALALRSVHLNWGLPDLEEEALPMKKAFEMWGWDGGGLSLDPQTAGWPSFSFYVHLLLQKLHFAWGRLSGHFHDRYDYWLMFQLDPTELALLSRALSALLGAAIAALGFEWTRRALGPRAGIFAGLLLACSPLAVQYSQLITPDILVMFFAALATWSLTQLEAQGKTRDYVLAALFIGLGAASKYTPVLLTLALYALHLKRLHGEGRSLRWLGWNDPRLWLAAFTALLSFCVASPYTFADLEVLRRDFAYQAMHMSRGHFGQTDEFGPWVYLRRNLAPALGWPVLLLGLAGLVAAARRRWTPLAVFLAFFLGLGFLNTRFDRYLLPTLLPLAFGAAYALERLLDLAPARTRRVVAAAAILVLLLPPARGLRRYQAQAARPSTQWEAKQYIFEHVSHETAALAIENYTVFLPYQQTDEWQEQAVFQALSSEQRARFLDQPFYDYVILPMYSARTELSAFYYDLRHFIAYDWILTSSSVRGRYERQSEQFPEQMRFYSDLDRYCELKREFEPRPGQRGPEIRMYQFRSDGVAALLADRGPLRADAWQAHAEHLHPAHFFNFLDQVALHALNKRSLDTASLYYQMELASCPDEEKARVRSQLAFIAILANDWSEAKRLYLQVLKSTPEDHVAHGNLGIALWKLGEIAAARQSLQRCIALAPDEATLQWARSQLAELDADAARD